jgi:hypothetical protein
MSEVITTEKPDTAEAKEQFANYSEYNKTLRTWFVSFGVGGPVALLINPGLLKPLKEAQDLAYAVYPFLFGCAVQILVALLNKYSSWYAYAAETHPPRKSRKLYKFWVWVSVQIWIDILADLLTVAAFGWAVFIVVITFVRAP